MRETVVHSHPAGNQSAGPWMSLRLGRELSMLLLSLSLPLKKAKDLVFLHFSLGGREWWSFSSRQRPRVFKNAGSAGSQGPSD